MQELPEVEVIHAFEPRSEKTFGVSDQLRHKPGCTVTEDG